MLSYNFDLEPLVGYAEDNEHVAESLKIIEDSVKRYGLNKICISFNGGKDCTVLLHMLYGVCKKLNKANGLDPNSNHAFVGPIKAFYVVLTEVFDDELKFVTDCTSRYNLNLLKYSSTSIKTALAQLKSGHPEIEAIFVGTRHVDLKKGSSLATFQITDPDWPKFMRINPILKWTYRQVWDFLRSLEVPYCQMYNQGYSSIGTIADTSQNSSLLKTLPDGTTYYMPAWALDRPEEERKNRS